MISKVKICVICDKKFIYITNKQIYCSNLCNRKAYALRHPDRVKKSTQKWKDSNKDKIRKIHKEWYSSNKDRMAIYRKSRATINREYWKKRRLNDPIFRLTNNMRNRMNSILKNKSKKSSIMKYVGCSIEELKQYLESKFQEGMSWDNYGKYNIIIRRWNLDHIIPLSIFDLSKEEELEKAWHYTNLQPLWAKENNEKWCKIEQ